MVEKHPFAVPAAILFFARLVFSVVFAAEPGGSADVIRAFTCLVEKEAEGIDYLEAENEARIRTEAEKIFPLRPSVSSKEAARMDREGEKAFLEDELSKVFPLSEAENRRIAEKEAETVFPLYRSSPICCS